jgi:hypothetical protein
VRLSDVELTQLARDAVDSVDPALSVRVAPSANDDPYRWGAAGWTITVETRPPVALWVPGEAAPEWVWSEITGLLRRPEQQ